MSILEHRKTAGDTGEWNTPYWLRCLQLGPSGSGKTQLTITLPRKMFIPTEGFVGEEKPVLLIDYDNRSETLRGEKGIEILTLFDRDPNSPKAWRAGESLRKELWALVKKKEFPFSAVVEDSLSMMGQVAMNDATTLDTEHLGLGGSPGQSHWLPQIHYLRTHINGMRLLPCHYVLNAHLDSMVVGDTGVKYYPKTTRSLKPEIPTWFNETYRIGRKAKEGGGVVYYWMTAGSGRYDLLKSTLNTRGKFWKDPVVLNLDKEVAGFSKVLALRFGKTKMEMEEGDGEVLREEEEQEEGKKD